jgi:hypothetical protein
MPKHQEDLKARVSRAAEDALSRQRYVSAIDVLCGMGLLAQTNVDSWRKGRIDVLEEFIQGRPDKISFCLEFFRQWAHQKGLKPSEAAYVRTTRAGTAPLQFTHAADPETEKNYRIHYLSAALTERKRQHLEDKLNQAPRPVVFEVLRESQCVECGTALDEGSFLFMEADQSLCLACASFGDLEYLAAGDTALTRRATKYSERVAIVVRFSRSRKRYERQGVLLEAAALDKAERECVQDADARAASRLRAAEQRRAQDRDLVSQMTEQIGVLFPGCPPQERAAIAEHTALRGSGRVGRTHAGRALEAQALTAAVVAAVRHQHTDYDNLLATGVDRTQARERVAATIDGILSAWRAHRG